MDDFERYFDQIAAGQLERAERPNELRACLLDLSWIRGKLSNEGVAGLDGDLARLSSDPAVAELRLIVRRSAHVLGAPEPPSALNSTILSRLPDGPARSGVLDHSDSGELVPRLIPVWPIPDNVPVLGGVAHVDGTVTVLRSFPGRPLLLVGTDRGVLRVLTSDSLAVASSLTGHLGAITAVAVSAGDGTVVTADSRGGLILWAIEPGELLPTDKAVLEMPHDYAVERCAFFPSGRRFATASRDGVVFLWDTQTRRPVQRLGDGFEADPNNRAGTLLVDPAERWIMFCVGRYFEPPVTSAWRLPDGPARHPHGDFVPENVSASGRAIGRTGTDVVEWDPLSGPATRLIARGWLSASEHFPRLRNQIRRMLRERERGSWIGTWAAGRDGATLVRVVTEQSHDDHSVGIRSSIEVLDRSRDQRHLRVVQGEVASSAHGPGAEWVAIGTNVNYNMGEVYLCRPGAADPIRRLGSHRSPVTAVTDGDGEWLATGDRWGGVRIWPLRREGTDGSSPDHSFPAAACRSAPGGTWVALVDSYRTVHVIDAASGQERCSIVSRENIRFINGYVFTCEITADGRWIVSADDDGAIYVSDARDGTRHWTWPGHGEQIMASAATGRWGRPWVAAVDAAGHLTVGEPSSGRLLHTGSLDLSGAVVCAADPRGRWLAVAGGDRAYLLQPDNEWSTRQMTGVTEDVSAMAPNADGEFVVIGDSAGVVSYHHAAGSSLQIARIGLGSGIEQLAIGPAGGWLAAVTKAGELAVLTPDRLPAVLTRTDGVITACRASLDGSRLVTACEDGTVTVWDPRLGQAITGIRVEEGLRDAVWLPATGYLCLAGDAGGYLLTLAESAGEGKRPPGSPVKR